jgi:hypothetical protein
MNTHAQVRVERAIRAQQEGMELAISRGDLGEEKRRKLARDALQSRQSRAERTQHHFFDLVLRMEKEAARLSREDWLAKLSRNPRNGIGDVHLRTAGILRDHLDAAVTGSCEALERVDGGRIHNGQMEALCDRRRPLRVAMNAAMEAVEDQKLMPVAMTVILWGRSIRQASDWWGLGASGGRMSARVTVAITEALDAAAANIGVAK